MLQVPCCVYSELAPRRRDPRTGRTVQSMSYAAFIEYLQAKAPGVIGTAVLPFEGKNVVVYRRPPRTPLDPQEEQCAECEEVQ